MRDIALLLFMVCAIPAAFIHPVYGVYLWTWLSVMNPHRLTWGFSVDLPFAMFTALATLIGLVVTKDKRRWPIAAPTVALALFLAWMTLAYPFALFPDQEFDMWNKVMKIQIMTLVAAALVVEREHVKRLVWVLVISLGFYGVKGGIFTIMTAGAQRVWGPSGTFIEGNNEIALALIIAIPLMWYLFEVTTTRWNQIRSDCGDGAHCPRRAWQPVARGVGCDHSNEYRDLVVQQAEDDAWNGAVDIGACGTRRHVRRLGTANGDDFRLRK